MKICRFNHNRIGVVVGDTVIDITSAFDLNPAWPLPPGDWLARQLLDLPKMRAAVSKSSSRLALHEVSLASPIANPGKIIGAPINYRAHIDEANADSEINNGTTYTNIDEFGLFLKAGSSLIGPSETVMPRFSERRTDHEAELAVIIGKEASFVKKDRAFEHILGFTIGLDMTVRGKEFPSFRKSPDTYTVLGPWLVTFDEIPSPDALELRLSVNGIEKQRANTSQLIFSVARLIEYASSFYTLFPGDIIMTGTPQGVGPVQPGDTIDVQIEAIGELSISVGRAAS